MAHLQAACGCLLPLHITFISYTLQVLVIIWGTVVELRIHLKAHIFVLKVSISCDLIFLWSGTFRELLQLFTAETQQYFRHPPLAATLTITSHPSTYSLLFLARHVMDL